MYHIIIIVTVATSLQHFLPLLAQYKSNKITKSKTTRRQEVIKFVFMQAALISL